MKIRFPKITRTETVRIEPDGDVITVAEIAAALAALEQDAEVDGLELESARGGVVHAGGGRLYRDTSVPTGAAVLRVVKVRTAK